MIAYIIYTSIAVLVLYNNVCKISCAQNVDTVHIDNIFKNRLTVHIQEQFRNDDTVLTCIGLNQLQ